MLLIPGDLTKDGEKVSHQDLLKLLKQFDLAHIKVFVVPYDIETGSMVTAPVPYRMITVKGNTMDISTSYVKNISAPLPGGLDFTDYSTQFLSGHLDGYIGYAIANPPYSLPAELVDMGAPLLRDGFMAHYAGDEKIKPAEQLQVDAFGQLVPPLGDAVNSLWTDLAPADNNLKIKLPFKLFLQALSCLDCIILPVIR